MRFGKEGRLVAALLRNQLPFFSSTRQDCIFEYISSRPVLQTSDYLCRQCSIIILYSNKLLCRSVHGDLRCSDYATYGNKVMTLPRSRLS